MKVLVVDDNEGIVSILKLMLEAEGFEVESAKDGKDAYLVYLLFHPDLVITDIQMPIENGFELMKHIRLHDPGMKAVYMSGNLDMYQDALEEESVKYPVKYLEKPFSMRELMDSLREQLGARS